MKRPSSPLHLLLLFYSLLFAVASPAAAWDHIQVTTSTNPARWEVVTLGVDPIVLAYGEGTPALEAEGPFRWMLEQYDAAASALQAGNSAQRIKRRAAYRDIPTLLTCHWAQGDPFNRLCPTFGGSTSHTRTGCVATAMAQVLYYHKLPTRLHGNISYTYTSSEGLKGPDGSTTIRMADNLANYTIDWPNLIDSPWNRYTGTASCTAVEGNAVATLMYVCGLATKMQYGYKGSGASVDWATEGINNYFDGLKAEHVAFSEDVILSELEAGRPVIYSGGGHCFVIDGASADGYLHCNLGWGGGGEVDEQGHVGNPDGYYLPTVMAGYTNGKSIVRLWPDGTQEPWKPSEGGGSNPTGVGLTLTSATLQPGETLQLNPYVLPATLTGSYTFSFSSSDPKVATVTSEGLVRAIANGTATITVALSTNTFVQTTCEIAVRQAAAGSLEGTVVTDFDDFEPGALYTIYNPASEAFLVVADAASHEATIRGLLPSVSASHEEYYTPADANSLGSFWSVEKVNASDASDHQYYISNLANGLYIYFAGSAYALTEKPTPLFIENKQQSRFTINWGRGLSDSGYSDYLAMNPSLDNPVSKGGNAVGNNRMWNFRLIPSGEVPTGTSPCMPAHKATSGLRQLPLGPLGHGRSIYVQGGKKMMQ